MNDSDAYKEPSIISESIFKDKGSKHFGYVYSVKSEQDIQERLAELKKLHYASRHICYAYSLGITNVKSKSTDDGEPHNSAGPPILGQINSFELHNTLVAVVRYFGGTKLGVGGLINAYKTAAKEAILANTIITKYRFKTFQLDFPYDLMSDIMRFSKRDGITIVAQDFRESCKLTLQIREKYMIEYQDFLSKLHLLTTKEIKS